MKGANTTNEFIAKLTIMYIQAVEEKLSFYITLLTLYHFKMKLLKIITFFCCFVRVCVLLIFTRVVRVIIRVHVIYHNTPRAEAFILFIFLQKSSQVTLLVITKFQTMGKVHAHTSFLFKEFEQQTNNENWC